MFTPTEIRDYDMVNNPILPAGFRFHPTDEELIVYYLKEKVTTSPSNSIVSIIADIDLYKFNPWELPDKASFGGEEWFFYTPRDRKYPNGARPNRATKEGYWKATGCDKPILSSKGSQCIGVKKALVFYQGRPPRGTKTNWMMYEYRLPNHTLHSSRLRGSMRLDDWVLCRIRNKSNTVTKEYQRSSNCSYNSSPSSDFDSFEDKNIPENFINNYGFSPQVNEVTQQFQDLNVQRQDTFQHIISGEDLENRAEPSTGNSVNEALSSIRRMLSIGALDDL